MIRTEYTLTSLTEMLEFVAYHGGAVRDLEYREIPGSYPICGKRYGVELFDGSQLIVTVFTRGPYSEVTPDIDIFVEWTGYAIK